MIVLTLYKLFVTLVPKRVRMIVAEVCLQYHYHSMEQKSEERIISTLVAVILRTKSSYMFSLCFIPVKMFFHSINE